MDKDSAVGWVIIGAVAYLGYKALKQGSLFGGAAAALFGDDLASGKVGEQLGEAYYNQPTGQTGAQYGAGLPGAGAGAVGVQTRAAVGVVTLNLDATDPAFAKIGLTTTQVLYLQQLYPKLVNGIVVKLTNKQALTAEEKAALTSVGAASAFAPIVTDIGGGQYVGIGVGGFQDPTYGF